MPKRTILLLLLFVVLVGAYWLTQSKRPVVTQERPFVEVDSSAINRFGIVYGPDSIALARHNDGWWIEYPLQYPATERLVRDAVGKIQGMDIESLITDKPENFATYEVDTVGVRVHVFEEGVSEPIGFIIGKNASDYQHTYMRQLGQNKVWLVKGTYRQVYGKALKDWRDRTITELPMDSVRWVELVYPQETITLDWQDTVWQVTTPTKSFAGEKPLVDRLLRLLCRVSAVDFLDTLGQVSFEKPDVTIRARLSGYEPLEMKLVPLDETGEKYVVEKTGALTHFVIYKTTATTLMKKAEDFRTEALAKKKEALEKAGK